MAGRVQLLSMLSALFFVVAFAAGSSSDHSSVIVQPKEDNSSTDPIRELHESWMRKHKKAYNGNSEKEKRFRIFKGNLTNSEFREHYVGKYIRVVRPPQQTSSFKYEDLNVTDIPASIDWRTKGAVRNPGSCWAFSSVAAVEGLNFLATSTLVSLSEQELVDCDTVNQGCNGGLMQYAFEYIIKNGGITTGAHYPYKGHQCTRSA